MQIFNHILYLSWEELEALGVPYNSIHIGTKRARKGAGRGWLSIQDPSDKRRCLVQYDSIPASTVKACGLPSVAEMQNRYKQELEKQGFSALLNMLPAVGASELAELRAFRVMKEIINPATGEVMEKDMGGLPELKIQEYLKQAQWLSLLLLPVWHEKAMRKRITGADTFIGACEFIASVALKMGVKLPLSYRQLSEKLNDFKVLGVRYLIHSSYGNKNAQKLNEAAEAALIQMYSHKNKPSATLVHSNYVQQSTKQGQFAQVSARTVQRVLSKQENAQIVALNRDGYKQFNNLFGHETKGKRPSFSDAQWNIDGTKVNLAYRNVNGRGQSVAASKLKMVVVMDCYSDAFIGWYISEHENIREIAGAVRNAIERAGNLLPHQFISDQDGTNQLFFKNYTGLHQFAMANHGQSKYIERAFGSFQDSVLRGYNNFTGMNITAKGSRSRINMQATGWDETLGVKVRDLPTIDEVYMQIEEAIRIWNHTPTKSGKTRWQKYQEGKRAVARMYNEADELQMFFEPRKALVSYTKAGIVLETNGFKKQYEVYTEVNEGVGVPNLDFHTRYVNEQFLVKQDMHGLNENVALFLIDSRGQERFIAWAQPKVEVARAAVDHSAVDSKQFAMNLKAKRAQLEYLKEKGSEAQQVANTFGFETQFFSKEVAHTAYEEMEAEVLGWTKPEPVAKQRKAKEEVSRIRPWPAKEPKPRKAKATQTVSNEPQYIEPMSELERLKAQNEALKRQLMND